MARKKITYALVVCIENRKCEDLKLRQVYKVLPDPEAEKEGYLRIVDDSGEDYLYPGSYFSPIKLARKLSPKVRKVLQLAS